MRTLMVAVLLVATALAVTFTIRGRQAVARSQPASSHVVTQVEQRTLRRTVDVRGELTESRRSTLRSELAGRVTSVPLRVGRRIRPGAAVVEIDGRTQVAVGGAFPFWRGLGSGDRGKDVRQLQRILRDDGHDALAIDGDFGPGTREALRVWQRAHGVRPADGALRLGDMLVLRFPVRIAAVRVDVGDRVAVGDAIADVAGDDVTVTVDLDAAQRVGVRAGQPVTIELVGTRRRFDGVVGKVAQLPVRRDGGGSGDSETGDGDAQPEMVYPAEVTVGQRVSKIVGAPVRVEIVTAEAVDVSAVPLAAVVTGGDGSAVVQVVERSRLRQVPVTIGVVDGAYVEVHGLAATDRVVVGAR